jgi:hypothetical protein
MATNDVIAGLVRDLRPVHPLAVPGVRTAAWAVATGAIAAIVTTLLGLRADLGAVAVVPSFHVHVVLLLFAALGSAAAALVSAVPGEAMGRWRRLVPFFTAAAWCVWLIAEVRWFAAAGGAWWPIAAGWGCVAKAAAIASAPAALLIAMIAKAAPPELRRTCTYAGLASAAVGAIGVELTCPLTNPMHLLLWHAGPAMAAVPLAALAASLVVARRSLRHPGSR